VVLISTDHSQSDDAPSIPNLRTRAEVAPGYRSGTVAGAMRARPTVHYFYQRKVQIGIEMMADQRKDFSPPLIAPKLPPTKRRGSAANRALGEQFTPPGCLNARFTQHTPMLDPAGAPGPTNLAGAPIRTRIADGGNRGGCYFSLPLSSHLAVY
jgi:hypothetical protein